MPELPEVETVRRTLAPVLIGRTIRSVRVRLPKLTRDSPISVSRLRGDVFTKLDRRAKLLLFSFQSGRTLVVHLKMTGQLIHRKAKGGLRVGGHPIAHGADRLPNQFTRAILGLSDRSELFFNDLRKFGYFRLMRTDRLPGYFSGLKLGPEPLSPEFTLGAFREAIGRRKLSRVKDVLLDQTVIAGLGNIYADEVDFAARLHPERRVRSLTERDIRRLYRSINLVLRLAIEKKGTTIRHFRDGHGSGGGMQRFLNVYGRTGLPCYRCRTLILRIKLGSRSAHFCPTCQRLKK